MRELEDPAGLPRGLQAEQAPGRYRLTRDPQNRYFAWANGPQAIKPQAFAAKESLWRVERDDAGALQFAAVLPAVPAQAIIGVQGALTISTLAEYATIVFVVFVALEQLAIGTTLLTAAFQIGFGAIGLALALAFGLGGREWAAGVIKKLTEK
ncbi:MAG: hypothetical protein CVU23_14535 [Betaproteobacteria bacterium HGW-Betaproteobacteria-17]|nr:MAG: hypothetical protein CVU23_14535 [Betaproteobacteria bacterium HGW-Betaproteobacteria-17]